MEWIAYNPWLDEESVPKDGQSILALTGNAEAPLLDLLDYDADEPQTIIYWMPIVPFPDNCKCRYNI